METQPFFKRGPSLRVRLALFVLLSVSMMVTDARFSYLAALRQGISLAIYPVQRAANGPVDLFETVSGFFVNQGKLQMENLALRRQQLLNVGQLHRLQALEQENAYLRRLLGADQRFGGKALAAEVIHGGQDPFVRKIIVDRGSYQGVQAGNAVIDDMGVVGQVTRVTPFTSEVTLVTDKDQSVPVSVLRNGLRAVVMGAGQADMLSLPYMPVNTDIQPGDVLVTSGIDGTYPPGLPVATVSKVDRNPAYAFAHISCTPKAGVDAHAQVLILSGYKLASPIPAKTDADPAKHDANGPAAQAKSTEKGR